MSTSFRLMLYAALVAACLTLASASQVHAMATITTIVNQLAVR